MRANKQKQKPAAQLETSPERVEAIISAVNGLCDVGELVTDAFSDEGTLRALAACLRLPYLQVQLMRPGTVGLTEEDVDEYNTWRAALDRKAGVR